MHRSCRLIASGLLALSLVALGGCGRHHRQELQSGGEPPLTGSGDGSSGVPPIVNRESPTVQRWAGGD